MEQPELAETDRKQKPLQRALFQFWVERAGSQWFGFVSFVSSAGCWVVQKIRGECSERHVVDADDFAHDF